MSENLLHDIAAAVQAWETAIGGSLIRAQYTDWRPDVLYAEWIQIPDLIHEETYYARVMNRHKTPEFKSGFSNTPGPAAALCELLRAVEHDHGVILGGVVANRKDEYLAADWHLPGADVRKTGRAPVAAVAAAGAIPPAKTEKGVA